MLIESGNETVFDAGFLLNLNDTFSVGVSTAFDDSASSWSVDGRLYFDRDEDLQRRQALAEERHALMEAVRQLEDTSDDEDASGDESSDGEATAEAEGAEPSEPPEFSYLVWQDAHDSYCHMHDDDGDHR